MPPADCALPSGEGGRRGFTTTHWSVVLAAGADLSPDASEALEKLCRTYWYPLYAYVRRRGYAPEDAQDLTQGFFASFLEKNSIARADRGRGRFRTFLLAALENFLRGEWDRARAQKRGGGRQLISWDGAEAEGRYLQESAASLSPDKVFEKRWAATLLEQVLHQLRRDFARGGKVEFFEQLKPHLWGEDDAVPYARLAQTLNMSANALKVAVHRLRHRYRELLRQEIAHTVAEASEIDDEIRHLMAALSQ